MKKLNLFIAALHASAVALSAFPGASQAQEAAEIRAYMDALSAGTPEAMQEFLQAFPQSALPGSALGAQIAASMGMPTAATQPAPNPNPSPAATGTPAGNRDVRSESGLY
jgi:hypothetical protein